MSRDPDDPRWTPEHETDAVAAILLSQLGPEHHQLAAVFNDVDHLGGLFEQRVPRLLPPRPQRASFLVTVLLDATDPPVWRRLELASDLDLGQVHQALQVAMGWTDSHLHHFVLGDLAELPTPQPFLTEFDLAEGEQGIPESDVRLDEVLGEPGDLLSYEYDFGDGWLHYLRLEAVEPWSEADPPARCVAGERACPPEDVGGVGGFAELLEVLAGKVADKNPAWVQNLLDWLPDGYDPELFDLDRVNRELVAEPPPLERLQPMVLDVLAKAAGPAVADFRRLTARALVLARELTAAEAEAAVHRFQVLLATVGDGITLTKAGFLPPAVVTQLWDDLGLAQEWFGKGNREENVQPVLHLRHFATTLGLLRKAKGRLNVTAAGRRLASDPVALFDHLRSRLPFGTAAERDGGVLALIFTAAGGHWYREPDAATELLAMLGWQQRDGSPPRNAVAYGRPMMWLLNCLSDNSLDLSPKATIAGALLLRPE